MSQPTTGIFLNGAVPAAPTGDQNVTFQSDNNAIDQSVTAYPKTATASLRGVVKPDGTSITIAGDGTISAATPVGMATKAGVQQESYVYAADTGAANAYAVTLSPVPTIVAGSQVVFKAAHANTGTSTLAVNGGAATPIYKQVSTQLVAGDILAGQIVSVKYDGTNWQIGATGSLASGTAAPAIRGSNIASSNSSTTITVALPAGTLAGDLAVCFLGQAWPSRTLPAGWTLLRTDSSLPWMADVFYKVLSSGDIATGSVTCTASNAFDIVLGIVTFIGPTGGIRESEFGIVGGALPPPITNVTSSAVLSTDAILYFATMRFAGGPTAPTITPSSGSATNLQLAVTTNTGSNLADQSPPGGVLSVANSVPNSTAFWAAQVVVIGVPLAPVVTSLNSLSGALTLQAGANVTITPSGSSITIAATGGGGGTPGGSSGQVQYNNAGAFGGLTVGGDGSLVASTGVLTITKTSGAAFAASATTDTTNANNISSGTIPAARLPLASSSAFGAVKVDGTSITASGGVISAAGGGTISLTTTGTSGAASLTGGVLNIPVYSGGGGGGGGLYNGLMSSTPTLTSIALPTNYNQSGTFSTANVANGVLFQETAVPAGAQIEGLLKAYPGAAYTLTLLMTTPFPTISPFGGAGIAVATSTTGKAIWFGCLWYTSPANSLQFVVYDMTAPGTQSTNHLFSNTGSLNGNFPVIWLRLKDDGTNITFYFSYDGFFFTQLYTVTRAASSLGASGFNFLGFVLQPQGTKVSTVLQSWTITTP